MRKIDKDFDDVPAALHSQNCLNHVNDIISAKQYIKKDSFYGHHDIKEKLEKLYNNKCAFCETDPTAGAYLEVEHYRPKSEAKELLVDKKIITRPGYYWLAHEWTNLLYACRRCNGGKSSFFPLNGAPVTTHPTLTNGNFDITKCHIADSDLQNEYPLLLNPEIDNPNEHIQFLSNGKVNGITTRGTKTIEICKLNRKSLLLVRQKLIDDIMFSLMEDVSDLKKGKIDVLNFKRSIWKEINKIATIYAKNQPYSILALTILQQFEIFFINRFQPADRIHFQEIYTQLKQQFNSL